MNNILALILTFAIALAWLRLMDFFAHRGWIESRLSRKIIHIGTGPIFVLCWLLFKETPEARYLAALVPLAITGQFVLVGLGVIRDEAAVKAMSRTGDRREILRGPLFYGIAFVLLTILYWKDSPIGMTALMLMCGGDGVADLVGRRVRSPHLPWSPRKTVAGSLAVFLGGFLLSGLVLTLYVLAGVFPGPMAGYLAPLLLIALIGTLVESLPFPDVDNLTVTLAAVIMGHLVW
ncbi:MAG: phosphatidate cytidylyltransferase [Anaerolineae bacterium]|nr:MAG: phosphatidate cytidylyltransferase [Anaerolineae bacterium]